MISMFNPQPAIQRVPIGSPGDGKFCLVVDNFFSEPDMMVHAAVAQFDRITFSHFFNSLFLDCEVRR